MGGSCQYEGPIWLGGDKGWILTNDSNYESPEKIWLEVLIDFGKDVSVGRTYTEESRWGEIINYILQTILC